MNACECDCVIFCNADMKEKILKNLELKQITVPVDTFVVTPIVEGDIAVIVSAEELCSWVMGEGHKNWKMKEEK